MYNPTVTVPNMQQPWFGGQQPNQFTPPNYQQQMPVQRGHLKCGSFAVAMMWNFLDSC